MLIVLALNLAAPFSAFSEFDDSWVRQRFEELDRQKARRNAKSLDPSSRSASQGFQEWLRSLGSSSEAEKVSQDCSDCSVRHRPTQENLGAIKKISEGISRQSALEAGSGQWRPIPASDALRNWFYSDNTRGRNEKRQLLPQKDGRGNYKVMICAGAGCPMKIPFLFTAEMLETVKAIGVRTLQNRGCNQDHIRCEIMAAQEMGRQMEKLVVETKLRNMSFEEMKRAYGANEPLGGNFEHGKQLDLDCVDQSANGSSYFLILKDLGLYRHAEVLSPGYMLPSHWFTRIQGDDGNQYRTDFYHRGRHGVLPGVVKL